MRYLAFFSFLFFTLGCTEKTSAPEEVVEKTYSYLALGDSYTIGEGVANEFSWPAQLTASLISEGKNIDSLKIIARTGWTTGDLQTAMSSETLEDFDMVSLLIGVNNQYQRLSFDDFKPEFDSLLLQAISIAGGSENVFLVSIPDYGVTPFGAANSEQIARELDEYNSYMKAQGEASEIPFVNITDISRSLGNGENALAPDQLHPSGTQYAQWVERILPVALQILNN